jgi:spermidine synthase
MKKFLQKNILLFSVFITGACVLIVEVVAVRVLSPYYGSTIFTVSSVISVILAALSLGYYVGGRMSDKYPSPKWFFGTILTSGVGVVLFHLLSRVLLPTLSSSFSLTTGPLISSLLLFFLPAFLLGTLSPYALKLESIRSPKQGIGSVSGKIFFWSTLGSIVGSLLAGFVLIPSFGIDQIFMATGTTLFVLGLIPLVLVDNGQRKFLWLLILVFILVLAIFLTTQTTQTGLQYTKDGVYEKITIYDGMKDGRPVRFFQQDRSSSGAMFLDSEDPTDLVYNYTKYYSIYKVFRPDVRNVLVIGGGAYSLPKAFLAEFPKALVDVSEIEPSLFDLAKKYFKLEESVRLQNYTEDGRRLLQDSNKKYDLIFSDVYYSLFSIPAHFTTQEFFKLSKEKLTDDGIFMANLIGDLVEVHPSLVLAEMKTFRSVFPNSYFFAVTSPLTKDVQNIIVVGYNSRKKIDFDSADILQSLDSVVRTLPNQLVDVNRFDLSKYPILTDNFSPVEYLTAKVLERTVK